MTEPSVPEGAQKMSDNPERQVIFAALQNACHGQPPMLALAATVDSLAMLMGFLSDTEDGAEVLLDRVADALGRTIAANWEITRGQRALAAAREDELPQA